MKQVSLRELDSLDYSGKEALNSIATNLTFVGRHMNKFILTSCVASEGKSSLCMQLMLNLAQRGNSVVMVDADLRASFLMSRLKFEQGGVIQGLVHYLAGYCELDQAIYQTDKEGAYIIPTGDTVANQLRLCDRRRSAGGRGHRRGGHRQELRRCGVRHGIRQAFQARGRGRRTAAGTVRLPGARMRHQHGHGQIPRRKELLQEILFRPLQQVL